MKKVISTLLLPLMLIGLAGVTAAHAASGYPINKPKELDWSFAGPFGTYDKAQLQRGFQIYREACSS